MIRRFKALGLTFIAVFAMSAVAVSAAQAAEFHSDSKTGHTIVEGKQTSTNMIKITNAAGARVMEFHCSKWNEAGYVESNVVSAFESHPTLESCELSPFGSATVSSKGCNFVYHANGVVDVSCSGTSQITFAGPGCTIAVPSQQARSSVSYSNSGSPKTMTVTKELQELSFTSSGTLCNFFGIPASGGGMSLTGGINFKGYTDTNGIKGGQVNFSWE